LRRSAGGELRRRDPHPLPLGREGQEVQGYGRRCCLCDVPARGRRHRPLQLLLGGAGATRRSPYYPRRRHRGERGRRTAALLHAVLRRDAKAGVESRHTAADRFLCRLEGSARRGLRQRLQGAMGALPQARRGRGPIPLGTARRRERRAACRARVEELAPEEVARRAEAQDMKLRKLGSFGLEADDVEAPFREIWDGFFAGQILVFRGVKFTASAFLAFARQFGRPEPHVINQFHHPEHADILILSNVKKDGEPIGLADAGTYFHTDYSYLDVPARATLLYSIQVPKVGGDTLFADQYSAYDDLPAAMKERIDGLTALHHYGNRDDVDRASRTVASVLTQEQEQKMSWVRHPIVRKHPVTGRRAL